MAGQRPLLALFLVALFALVSLAGCVTEAEAPPIHFPSIQVDGVYTYKGEDYRVGADWDGVDRYLQNRTLIAFYPANTTDLGELENGTFLYDAATRDHFRRVTEAAPGSAAVSSFPFLPLLQLSGQPLTADTETYPTFLHDMQARLDVVDLAPAEGEDAWRVEALFRLGDMWHERQHNVTFNVTFARDGSWFHVERSEGYLEVTRKTRGIGPISAPEPPFWPRVAEGYEQDFAGLVDADQGPCSPPLTIRDLAEHPLVSEDLVDWLDAHPSASLAGYGYARHGTPLGRYNDRPDRHSVSVTFATQDGQGFTMQGSQYTGKPGEPEMTIENLQWGERPEDRSVGAKKVVPTGDLYCINRTWYGHDELPTRVSWYALSDRGPLVLFETDPPDSFERESGFHHQSIQLNGCTGALQAKWQDGSVVYMDNVHEPCWQRIHK